MSVVDTCYKCGQVKPVALYLESKRGERHPLCVDCAPKWLDSDEEWHG